MFSFSSIFAVGTIVPSSHRRYSVPDVIPAGALAPLFRVNISMPARRRSPAVALRFMEPRVTRCSFTARPLRAHSCRPYILVISRSSGRRVNASPDGDKLTRKPPVRGYEARARLPAVSPVPEQRRHRNVYPARGSIVGGLRVIRKLGLPSRSLATRPNTAASGHSATDIRS
jgi:hypothetical protein